MKHLILISILMVLLLTAFTACNKKKEMTMDEIPEITQLPEFPDVPEILEIPECTFAQIDEDLDGRLDSIERQIINACLATAFLSIDDVKNNLLGEWVLIGFSDGWSSRLSAPCASITFSAENLILDYDNATIDTTVTLSYEITGDGFTIFGIKTQPGSFDGLALGYFCTDFMFGFTAEDGNTFIYQKVKII